MSRLMRTAMRQPRGFTLIDAALTTVIVGVAFVAMLQLLAAGTAANIDSSGVTTGTNLARNVREFTLSKTFAQVRALNGATYQPPIDAIGNPVANASEWKQTVEVQAVDPTLLTRNIVDPLAKAVRVTATLFRNNNRVCDLSWYVFDASQP